MNIIPKALSSAVAAIFTVPEGSFGRIKQLNIHKDLKSGNWKQFESKLEQLNADDLTRVVDGICSSGSYNNFIKIYTASESSPTRALISGAFDLHIAWLKRGSGWGSSLSTTQVQQFEEYLERADNTLMMHFENPVYEAEAKARLIRVKMGMSKGQQAQDMFQYVRDLNSRHLLAHLNYFKAASPKWLGDMELLSDLLLDVEDKDLLLLLKLMYVVELYSDKYYKMHEEAEENFRKAKAALVPELLLEANPLNGDTLLAIYTNNYLACFYRILRMPLKEFMMNKHLIGRRTTYPWAYFG